MQMQICCRNANLWCTYRNLWCTYRNSNRQKPWH